MCIEFDKEKLLSAFDAPGVRKEYVRYKTIKELRTIDALGFEELPFLKRFPYGDECEFRVVYSGDHAGLQAYAFKLSWIRRITLSPWLPKPLFDSVKKVLRSIEGCSQMKISHSTLIDNETWKKVATRIRDKAHSIK